jgi:hypothetical protein
VLFVDMSRKGSGRYPFFLEKNWPIPLWAT